MGCLVVYQRLNGQLTWPKLHSLRNELQKSALIAKVVWLYIFICVNCNLNLSLARGIKGLRGTVRDQIVNKQTDQTDF